jgi:hypothetical protein
MNPSVSYDLAQARIADLRRHARREGTRAVTGSAQPGRRRIPGRLRLRAVLRHRVAVAS